MSRMDPNIGFICTVEVGSDGIIYREYPLPFIIGDLVKLENIAADDTKTIFYLEKSIPPQFGHNLPYEPNFLAPAPYSSRYLEKVCEPLKASKYSDDPDVLVQMGPACSIETIVGYGSNKVTKKIPVPKSVYQEWRMTTRNRERKRLLMRDLLRYAFSVNYIRGMREHRIVEKYNDKKILMYSTDTIGWTTYRCQITEEIAFRFDSNFGFGNSAYFFLSLTYKGVEVVPFSAYIRYKFANARTLMEHTYQYAVERRSWRPALQYVAETANAASRDPDRFVKERIWGEIKIMVDGLRQIMACRDFQEMTFVGVNGEKPQYLGVSIGDNFKQLRAIKPDEALLMIKAEKVVGALHLLHRLKTFSTISIEVSSAIASIVSMIKGVLPDVACLIESVGKEIPALKENLVAICAEIEKFDGDLIRIDKKLSEEETRLKCSKELTGEGNSKMSEVDSTTGFEERIRKLLDEKHQLERVRQKKKDNYDDLLLDISDRERFLSDLKHCYGAGISGERFLEVIEALEPHLKRIEKLVAEEEGKMRNQFSIDGLRKKVTSNYRAEHPDIEPLIKLRDEVLSEIDGLYYLQDKQQDKEIA